LWWVLEALEQLPILVFNRLVLMAKHQALVPITE
jgi:hypothetical protein